MIDDADLEERLLSYIIDQQRKVMFVITSVFEDIDNACSSILLWGSGDDEPMNFWSAPLLAYGLSQPKAESKRSATAPSQGTAKCDFRRSS